MGEQQDVKHFTLVNRNNAWILSDKVLPFILVCLKDGGSRLNTNADTYTILHASEISHNSLNTTNELPSDRNTCCATNTVHKLQLARRGRC